MQLCQRAAGLGKWSSRTNLLQTVLLSSLHPPFTRHLLALSDPGSGSLPEPAPIPHHTEDSSVVPHALSYWHVSVILFPVRSSGWLRLPEEGRSSPPRGQADACFHSPGVAPSRGHSACLMILGMERTQMN